MTKKIMKRKPTAKRKFIDGKTFIHPTLSYRLSDKRREMIDYVNHWVRLGLRFEEIAPLINKSPSTVVNYYYGFANHCLSSSQLEALKLIPGSTVTRTKVISRIADADETPDRVNVLMPVYTYITIHEFEEDELTNTQPIPFEILKIKYIPRSPNHNFGKNGNDRESWEYVDVIDSELTITKLKPYVIMYAYAACSI
ncbi:MAG: hypothetical protein AAF383_02920 [Cyanobacteria bacterium P01_A01_bin.83]